MSVVYIVFPLALVLAGVALAAYLWAVRSGQFDDLETPGLRVLNEEEDGRPGDPASPPRVNGAAGPESAPPG